MAVYEATKNIAGKKGRTRYAKGEKVHTVAGSVHDKRLAASSDWKAVDDAAKAATDQAKADG